MEILTPQYFENVLHRLGARNFNATPIFDQLVRKYSEPGHIYHSLDNHIEPGLKAIHDRILKTEHPNAVSCAWFFHDSVMDTARHDNEERSALWCREVLLGARVPSFKADEVTDLILATKHSQLVYGEDKRFICDIDLMSLALPWREFYENTQLIRQEYTGYSDEEFARDRLAFCRTMLSAEREHIFQTESIRDECELVARLNLRKTIRLINRNEPKNAVP